MEKIVKYNVCDRCGHETIEHDDLRGNESGYTIIDYRLSLGAKNYDGAWGGQNEKLVDGWLCLDCTKEFQVFMVKRK